MDKSQADRIEDAISELRKEVVDYAKATATNTADIAWLKRFVSSTTGLITLALGYVFKSR